MDFVKLVRWKDKTNEQKMNQLWWLFKLMLLFSIVNALIQSVIYASFGLL